MGETYTSIGTHSHSLRALSERIPDIHIVQFEITRPDSQGSREVIVRLCLLALGGNDGDLVRSIRRVVVGVPVHRQWPFELRDIDLLLISARVDEDGLLVGGCQRQCGDGFGNAAVFLARADG